MVYTCEVNRGRPYLFVPMSDFHKGEVKFLPLVISILGFNYLFVLKKITYHGFFSRFILLLNFLFWGWRTERI